MTKYSNIASNPYKIKYIFFCKRNYIENVNKYKHKASSPPHSSNGTVGSEEPISKYNKT